MSYGSYTLWDIYAYGLHPVCGTVTVVIAFIVFLVGTRDHPQRKPLWVGTIFGVVVLAFFVGEWGAEVLKLNRYDTGVLADPKKWEWWLVLSSQSRMMFMAQAGLAISFGLGLLWWPIRPKQES